MSGPIPVRDGQQLIEILGKLLPPSMRRLLSHMAQEGESGPSSRRLSLAFGKCRSMQYQPYQMPSTVLTHW